MAMQLVSEERLREIAEPLGGVEAMKERFAEHSRAAARLIEDWDELLEQYPDQWVAVGPEGVLATGDSNMAVLSELRGREAPVGEFVVKFFSTAPKVLIL